MAFLANNLRGQFRITGKINDGKGNAVAFASVFVPELNTGCQAGADGVFTLKNLPAGSFIFQFSCLGYKTLNKNVTVSDSTPPLDVVLSGQLINSGEVIVYGKKGKSDREVVRTTEQVTAGTMREEGALTLAEGLTKVAGVSQVTSGAGISKPVIRGLTGSRIQNLVLGIRFDNQNWGDEHGLGLSYIGIDRVEIIKGPYSLLYGAEAMGGVINIIEENPAPAGFLQADGGLSFFSNTLGYSTSAGVKQNNGKFNWRIRIGTESHADYQDGKNNRVINSRFNDYVGKASFGFAGKKWVSKNNYFFALNNYGFVGEAYDTTRLKLVADSRYSRDLYLPHHQVFINMFSTQNTFFLKHSVARLIAGVHFNNRQEQGLGYHPELDMQLNTYNASLLWEKSFGKRFELTLGTQHLLQTNRNLAIRNVIPDADLNENSAYIYCKLTFNKLFIDGGLRGDAKNIQTYSTYNQYAPSTDILPFNHFYTVMSGSLGTTLQLGKYILLKANGSNAYRAPNLAELSSNGLHEGTMRYEIGNTNLKAEQMYGSEASVQVNSAQVSGYVALFYNYFMNYIFLSPTNETYVGLPIYRYLQQDALMHGSDASITYNPSFLKQLSINESFSFVQGTRKDGLALPFIPPPRLNSEVRSDFKVKKLNCYAKGSYTYVWEQNQLALFEKYTPWYDLINAGAGVKFMSEKREITAGISCNNLLDRFYYDHLSRYKYFGVYNMGRNISVNLTIKFLKTTNNEAHS